MRLRGINERLPVCSKEIFGPSQLAHIPDIVGLGVPYQRRVHHEAWRFSVHEADQMTPKTLRGALNQIQEMLRADYSGDLWDILVALRGPDSRDRKLKYATTAIIRQAAFPKRPCETRSVFGTDNKTMAERRRSLFANREDKNHFREHTRDSFEALGLSLFEENVWNR